MIVPSSSTETLIAALRVLARDIQSDDGVANAAIAEAADRMEEMQRQLERGGARVEFVRTVDASDAELVEACGAIIEMIGEYSQQFTEEQAIALAMRTTLTRLKVVKQVLL